MKIFLKTSIVVFDLSVKNTDRDVSRFKVFPETWELRRI